MTRDSAPPFLSPFPSWLEGGNNTVDIVNGAPSRSAAGVLQSRPQPCVISLQRCRINFQSSRRRAPSPTVLPPGPRGAGMPDGKVSVGVIARAWDPAGSKITDQSSLSPGDELSPFDAAANLPTNPAHHQASFPTPSTRPVPTVPTFANAAANWLIRQSFAQQRRIFHRHRPRRRSCAFCCHQFPPARDA
jgi:hypothetical protein